MPTGIAPDGIGTKDQLLEIGPVAAVRRANHVHGIERPMRQIMILKRMALSKKSCNFFGAMLEP
jgi:hypothetical protein